jgi:hypothetical protein
MQIIADTESLQDIVRRNAAKPDEVYVTFEIKRK